MKKYFALLFLFFLAAIPLLAQDPVDPEPGLNIWTIVSGALAVLATIFGAAFKKIKSKFKDLINLIREGYELLTVVSDALGDNSVDQEEITAIKKEIADMKVAWKALWNK